MAQEVQTIIFSKDSWTLGQAREWLREHDFKTDVDETDTSYRFRQFDPDQCRAGSFLTLTENMPAGLAMVSCDRS